MAAIHPTAKTYNSLDAAFDFFNDRLFGGRLPPCLITMQRSKKAYGYFAGGRFGARDGSQITDEIALNPSHFHERTTEQSLSTLVHEMTHLEQHHFGKPSRGGYHNAEWSRMMLAVGLIPSDTGAPGGRMVGQRVSHYIVEGGPFARACAELVGQGFDALYVERWSEEEGREQDPLYLPRLRGECLGEARHAPGVRGL
jgi:predicted SprT family Zn-dependent metalloprotease